MFQAYIIRCLVTDRCYVGITSRTLKQRWSEHLYDARQAVKGMAISRAIAKHGAENFRIEPLCCSRSWADLCVAETALIAQWKTRAPMGYNLSDGGEGPNGVKRTAESVERSASKHRGKPCHPNTIAAARARRGVPKPSGHGAKVSAALTGRLRTDETKAKIRAYWAKRRADGEFKTAEPYAHGSKSIARKQASAMIAKIPLPLSRWIAATYR